MIFLILLLLSGCKTIRETQTEYVYVDKMDTIEKVILRLDSIIVKDSVISYTKGDSVFVERWHSEVKERLRVDTVSKIITRNVYYTKEKEIEKEVNRLYCWQIALMWTGVIAILTILLMIIWKSARHKR